MGSLTSGSDAVDAIRQIAFDGNIQPRSWFQHEKLRTEAGTLNLPAMHVLADIVYWYRPIEVVDEPAGRIVAIRRKFKYDQMYKVYRVWALQLGLTERQLRDAIAFLKRQGLIAVDVRTFTFEDGVTVGSMVFIEPVVEAIKEITFNVMDSSTGGSPTPSEAANTGGVSNKREGGRGKAQEGSRKSATTPTKNRDITKSTSKNSAKIPQQQTREAPADGGAGAAAVVESFDSLAALPPQEEAQVLGELPVQQPIPGVITAQPDVESEAHVNSLAQRLVHWAESEGQLLNAEGAVRIARRLPFALAGRGELLQALTSKREAAGLDKPIEGKVAQQMANEEERLRWHLATWGGHPESRAEYWEGRSKQHTRTSCFLRRFKDASSPPIEWLSELLAGDTRELHLGRRTARRAAAAGVWAILSVHEREAFEGDLRRRPPTSSSGTWLTRGTPDFDAARDERLLVPGLRERLAQVLGAPEVLEPTIAARLAPELEAERKNAQVLGHSPRPANGFSAPSGMAAVGDLARQVLGAHAPKSSAPVAALLSVEEQRAVTVLSHKLRDGEVEIIDDMKGDWDEASWARIKNAAQRVIELAA